jgi:DNA-binding IscR family transcriptional regulator
MKVVNRLATGGYIRTFRGKSGGLRLSRPAPDIRVGDVVRSSETDMDLVPCFSDDIVCALLPACDLRHALEEASDAFAQILDRYSIGDLTANRGPLRALLAMPRKPRRISSWPTKKAAHRAVSSRGLIASTADDNG